MSELHPDVQESFTRPAYPEKRKHTWTPVQEAAAKLYANGLKRAEVARLLVDHISPQKKKRDGGPETDDKRLKRSRNRLRVWEQETWFRDKIYQLSVARIDVASGQIVTGLIERASRGRVDAAKYAFEISGRHDPRGETAPTAVIVNFGDSIPRPERHKPTVQEIGEFGEPEDAEFEEMDD